MQLCNITASPSQADAIFWMEATFNLVSDQVQVLLQST